MSLIEMTAPDLLTADAEAKVVQWLVEPGQSITQGQLLLEIETDKTVNEVDAIASGTLKEILVAEGDLVEAGQVIATIESADSTKARSESAVAPSTSTHPEAPAPADVTSPSLSLSDVQRTVAKRTLHSKLSAPHFYLQTSVNAEPMIARRQASEPDKPIWDAFFTQAAGKALEQFDRMCARYEDNQLIAQPAGVVGVAVDIDDNLYVVPVENAADRPLKEISQEIRRQVKALSDRDMSATHPKPAGITITNLGVANIESFTAIINPPESAILAIGKIGPAVVAVNGRPIIQNRATLTLSVDHRVVNGRYAAKFLDQIVQELEKL